MFATFQTIINAGGYDLSDLTERIKTLYAMGELTEDEMKQLLEQAQHNAKPDDSYAPLADRVKTIEEWETTVEERLSKLKTGSSTNPGEPGAHDAYHNGDQITWNSQHYRCVAPVGTACVWNPDTYPAYWTLVE